MLRTLYCCALRLHPPTFRKRFADEMLSIFDQPNKTGAKFILFIDALFSLSRQWVLRPEFWHDAPSTAAAAADSDRVPTFYTISPFRPRGAAVIEGLILSGAVFCLTCFAIRYSWIHVLHIRVPEVQFERPSWIPSHATREMSSSLEQQRVASHPETQKPAESAVSTRSRIAQASPRAAIASRRRSLREQRTANPPGNPRVFNQSARSRGEIEPPLHIYEGIYMVDGPAKIMIVITTDPEDESLRMNVSGQSSFSLLPISETKFAVQDIDDCWIEFMPGDSARGSPIDEIQFSCNGQKYIAHRR